jgi:SAM-dependent methyltransferase
MNTKTEPPLQSLSAKKAETERPSFGDNIIDHPAAYKDSLMRTMLALKDLKELEKKGIQFDPFLEIGAGHGQRSAALINTYTVEGAATDISPGSLQDTTYVMQAFNYDRRPLLICCDAHHLPFLPDTFQFVFAYRTLHHFDYPVPVLAECHRVLGKEGHLFFNEEPLDSPFRRRLRGNRLLTSPPTNMQRLGYLLGMEKVFWDSGEIERQQGITEARFDIQLWRESLQPFRVIEVEVNRKLKMRSDLREPRWIGTLSGIVGGNIKGLCQKTGGEAAGGDFRKRLMCLDCQFPGLFFEDSGAMACRNCAREYPINNEVLRMFPLELELELFSKGQDQDSEFKEYGRSGEMPAR